MTALASTMSSGVARAWRGGRLVCEVVSIKCSRCGTLRHSLAPNVSDLNGPRDHEVRCYTCSGLLLLWLTSGSR